MAKKKSALTLRITRRELATILAALRFHQDENLQGSPDIPDQFIKEIATDGGLVKPLDLQEVSNLCERLNLDEGSLGGPMAPRTPAATKSIPPAIRRIHDLLYMDVKNGRKHRNPDKDWNPDVLDGIAEIVAEFIPRPRHIKS